MSFNGTDPVTYSLSLTGERSLAAGPLGDLGMDSVDLAMRTADVAIHLAVWVPHGPAAAV